MLLPAWLCIFVVVACSLLEPLHNFSEASRSITALSKAGGGRVHAASGVRCVLRHPKCVLDGRKAPYEWRGYAAPTRDASPSICRQGAVPSSLPKHVCRCATLRGGQHSSVQADLQQGSNRSEQNTTELRPYASDGVGLFPQHRLNSSPHGSADQGQQNLNCSADQDRSINRGRGLRSVRKSKPKGTAVRRTRGSWYVMYHRLCEYRMLYGGRRMTRHHRQKNCSCIDCAAGFGGLGAWVQKQLRLVKAKKMSTNRTQLLRSAGVLGFKGENDQRAWENRYLDLLAFRCRHGHVKVPQNRLVNQVKGRIKRGSTRDGSAMEDDVRNGEGVAKVAREISLGMWVMVQRRKRTMGDLKASQIRRLNEVGFVWNGWDNKWETRYYALLLYRQNFGDCNVPKKWKGLGSWVPNQRRFVKRGTMPPDRQAKLVGVGLWCNMNAQARPRNAGELRESSLAYQDPCNSQGLHGSQHKQFSEGNTGLSAQPLHACDGQGKRQSTMQRGEHNKAAVRVGPGGEPKFFSSQGLTSAVDILDLMAQGEFDKDIFMQAAREGLVDEREQWDDLYAGGD